MTDSSIPARFGLAIDQPTPHRPEAGWERRGGTLLSHLARIHEAGERKGTRLAPCYLLFALGAEVDPRDTEAIWDHKNSPNRVSQWLKAPDVLGMSDGRDLQVIRTGALAGEIRLGSQQAGGTRPLGIFDHCPVRVHLDASGTIGSYEFADDRLRQVRIEFAADRPLVVTSYADAASFLKLVDELLSLAEQAGPVLQVLVNLGLASTRTGGLVLGAERARTLIKTVLQKRPEELIASVLGYVIPADGLKLVTGKLGWVKEQIDQVDGIIDRLAETGLIPKELIGAAEQVRTRLAGVALPEDTESLAKLILRAIAGDSSPALKQPLEEIIAKAGADHAAMSGVPLRTLAVSRGEYVVIAAGATAAGAAYKAMHDRWYEVG